MSMEASTSTAHLSGASAQTPLAASTSSTTTNGAEGKLDIPDSDEEIDDEDNLLNELDDDFDLGGFRERRMEEMRAQMQATQKLRESNYGRLSEYKIEKEIISATAKAKRSIVHFFHRDFRRCKIMDRHLEKLAMTHTETLFIRCDVANAPFLVTKLDVKILPCVIGFVDGISKLKIVGFEELPGGDNFSTSSLETGLIQSEVLTKMVNAPTGFGLSRQSGPNSRNSLARNRAANSDDSD